MRRTVALFRTCAIYTEWRHGLQQMLMARAGEPAEVAPSFVFLASEDASYMSGQILHPNGGEIVNG